MAILDKRTSAGSSSQQLPLQSGQSTGRSRGSRRDSDLISTAASALRRLHFKAGKGPAVPKVMVMGSSTTSEATINTSTDSNNTAYTSVTVTTDADAIEDHSAAPHTQSAAPDSGADSRYHHSYDTSTEERTLSYSERSRELLNEFDLLFLENERRMENEQRDRERLRQQRRGALQQNQHEAKRTGRTLSHRKQHHQQNGVETSPPSYHNMPPQPCYCDNPGQPLSGKPIRKGTISRRESLDDSNYRKGTLLPIDNSAERRRGSHVSEKSLRSSNDDGALRRLEANKASRGSSGSEEDHLRKIQDGGGFPRAGSSSERDSDEIFNSVDDHSRTNDGRAPPPTPLLGELKREEFFSRSIVDEDAMRRHLDALATPNLNQRQPNGVNRGERRKPARSKSDRECTPRLRLTSSGDHLPPQRTFSSNFRRRGDTSPRTPRGGEEHTTRFPFPPRGDVFESPESPPCGTPGSAAVFMDGANPPTELNKTEVAALTLSNVEKHDQQVLENDKRTSSSPTNAAAAAAAADSAIIDSVTDNQLLDSCRRRKRNARKSISVETPIKVLEADEKISRAATTENYRDLIFEDKINSMRQRKYSVLASDGTVKNFVSETDRDFAKIAELAASGRKTTTANRRQSAAPVSGQRHRRVSIVQGESMRHFIFEEPDVPPTPIKSSRSAHGKHRNRKVSTVIENVEDEFFNRKSSLVPGDTLRNLLGDDFARKTSIAPGENSRKFSINTLGDIVSARKFSLLPPGEIYTSQIDGKTTEVIKLKPGPKGRPLATIVVQQASFQRPSISGPSGGDQEDLLDVANAFTLQELHEFDMKYGSPHHARSQSVKTPGRSCGRPNYLCLPQQRSRVASMPNTGVEEEYYRLRHFSIAGKNVVNRGDSLKSRRSRSNNSVASSNSSTEHLATNMGTVGSHPGSARTSAECSLASSRESSCTSVPYKVLMLGSGGVGKTSLVSQFMTSEYLQACDNSLDEEYGEKSVSVLLDGEESELIFVDHSSGEMSPDSCISTYSPQGFVVIYSVTDRSSVQQAEEILQSLWKLDNINTKAVILVANKTDLVRCRQVSSEEGKNLARSYDCKFIETSVGINHHVDELLVGILTQIRLKQQQQFGPSKKSSSLLKTLQDDKSKSRSSKNRNTRLTASLRGLRVKNLLGKVWARDSKSKSCENLHVL